MSTREHMNEDDPKASVDPPKEPEPLEMPDSPPPRKTRRGFAAMDPSAVRAIARKGGRVAHERGTAHRFTVAEAREAGRKGGLAPHRRRGGPPKHAE